MVPHRVVLVGTLLVASVSPTHAQVCTGFISREARTTQLRSQVAESRLSREGRVGAIVAHRTGLIAELAVGRVGYSGNGLREYVGPRFLVEGAVSYEIAPLLGVRICPSIRYNREDGPARGPLIDDFAIQRLTTDVSLGREFRIGHGIILIPHGSAGISWFREHTVQTVFLPSLQGVPDPAGLLPDGAVLWHDVYRRHWLAGGLGLSVVLSKRIAVRFQRREPLSNRQRVNGVTSVALSLGL